MPERGSICLNSPDQATFLQVHDDFPDNVEALQFLVQLAGELQEPQKRALFEGRLQKVERALAIRDDLPSPAAFSGAPAPDNGAFSGVAGEELLPDTDGFGPGAPLLDGAVMVHGGGGGKADIWQEDLGANLLPGLD